MKISEKRLAANRQNALKSTGPRTIEGKNRSRANAVKEALCALVVVPEDPAILKKRSSEIHQSFQPETDFQKYLASEVALLTIRIERAQHLERSERDKLVIRAELSWDEDRKLEANALGKNLADQPGDVVDRLRQTAHGCDWMIARWAMLAYTAESSQDQWTDEQTRMAFDLLATPPEFRSENKPGISIDLQGRVVESPGPTELARREIAELLERRERLEVLDEADHALARADLFEGNGLEVRRIRRNEADLQRRLRWSVAQLCQKSPRAVPSTPPILPTPTIIIPPPEPVVTIPEPLPPIPEPTVSRPPESVPRVAPRVEPKKRRGQTTCPPFGQTIISASYYRNNEKLSLKQRIEQDVELQQELSRRLR